MNYLDKAEFLRRLDVRFAAFSSLLEMHEKYIISQCGMTKKAFIDASKTIEKDHRKLYKFIEETDAKIFDFFEKAKLEADKQKAPTADVVEVVRCKDCKHSVRYECKNDACYKFTMCRRRDGYSEGVEDEDYCSYGERREENG